MIIYVLVYATLQPLTGNALKKHAKKAFSEQQMEDNDMNCDELNLHFHAACKL